MVFVCCIWETCFWELIVFGCAMVCNVGDGWFIKYLLCAHKEMVDATTACE